jgi:hypothetical protein
MAKDQPVNEHRPKRRRTDEMIRMACGVVFYLLAAGFAVSVLISAFVDYGRRFREIGLYLLHPSYFVVRGVLAGIALSFFAFRLIHYLRALRSEWRSRKTQR